MNAFSCALRHSKKQIPRCRLLSTSTPRLERFEPEVVDLCPSSSCPCQPTPQTELPISYDKRLLYSIPPYNAHVLVSTGSSDWPSRIDQLEGSEGTFLNDLTRNFRSPARQYGIRTLGTYYDPAHRIMITASDFPVTQVPALSPKSFTETYGSTTKRMPSKSTSLLCFPLGVHLTIPETPYPQQYNNMLDDLIQGYILPDRTHSGYDHIDPNLGQRLSRSPERMLGVPYYRFVDEVVVLICGHGSRDERCGVFGPVLKQEFGDKFGNFGIDLLEGEIPSGKRAYWADPEYDRDEYLGYQGGGRAISQEVSDPTAEEAFANDRREFLRDFFKDSGDTQKPSAEAELAKDQTNKPPTSQNAHQITVESRSSPDQQGESHSLSARVALISHIGGHAFAGNVIIYIPKTDRWKKHPLAGCGIWYGRVEPWHVEGIIEQTIVQGKIIGELFRDGLHRNGQQMSLKEEFEKIGRGKPERVKK